MPDRSREDELNLCIMDALSEVVKRAAALGQGLAQLLGLSVSDLVGLHKLEEPMTMKEMGQRMHCDPSFVTVVTNGLEKRGLARRETCERDRRIKHVTLTAEGVSMRNGWNRSSPPGCRGPMPSTTASANACWRSCGR